jgi:predicted ATPase
MDANQVIHFARVDFRNGTGKSTLLETMAECPGRC